MSRSTQTSLRLAIFDFDGTLCKVNSYHVFLWWAVKNSGLRGLLVLIGLVLRRFRIISRPTLMRLALRVFKGKAPDEVESTGRELYETALKPRLAHAGLAEIKAKRDEGYTIIVLSGAFDFLLAPFCVDQCIDLWRSTRLTYELDCCMGSLHGSEHVGDAKTSSLREYLEGQSVDWQESAVYSDEMTDRPLFSMVGHKYFVVHGRKHPPNLPPEYELLRW